MMVWFRWFSEIPGLLFSGSSRSSSGCNCFFMFLWYWGGSAVLFLFPFGVFLSANTTHNGNEHLHFLFGRLGFLLELHQVIFDTMHWHLCKECFSTCFQNISSAPGKKVESRNIRDTFKRNWGSVLQETALFSHLFPKKSQQPTAKTTQKVDG